MHFMLIQLEFQSDVGSFSHQTNFHRLHRIQKMVELFKDPSCNFGIHLLPWKNFLMMMQKPLLIRKRKRKVCCENLFRLLKSIWVLLNANFVFEDFVDFYTEALFVLIKWNYRCWWIIAGSGVKSRVWYGTMAIFGLQRF